MSTAHRGNFPPRLPEAAELQGGGPLAGPAPRRSLQACRATHHNLDDHAGVGVVAHGAAVQHRAIAVSELARVALDLVAAPAGVEWNQGDALPLCWEHAGLAAFDTTTSLGRLPAGADEVVGLVVERASIPACKGLAKVGAVNTCLRGRKWGSQVQVNRWQQPCLTWPGVRPDVFVRAAAVVDGPHVSWGAVVGGPSQPPLSCGWVPLVLARRNGAAPHRKHRKHQA